MESVRPSLELRLRSLVEYQSRSTYAIMMAGLRVDDSKAIQTSDKDDWISRAVVYLVIRLLELVRIEGQQPSRDEDCPREEVTGIGDRGHCCDTDSDPNRDASRFKLRSNSDCPTRVQPCNVNLSFVVRKVVDLRYN